MRGTGAARRREQDQEPPPDATSVEAALRRVIAGSEAVQRRLGRHERAIASELGRMAQLAAGCPVAERLAVSADKLASRYALVAVELISDAAHNAEAREACELYAQTAAFTEAMRAAAFEAGRQAGIAEERDRASRAPRSRPAHRKGHLKPVPGVPVAAVKAAVAASVVAASVGGAVVMHEESSVRTVASAPAAAGGVRQMAPDTAVEVPSFTPRAYVPRHAKPAADAASARPAPSPSLPASVPSSSVPVSQPSAAASGVLDVQTIAVVIGPDGTGTIVFSAVGGPAWWQASASSPDLSLSSGGGRLGDGQPGVITVTVRAGAVAGTGTVTLTDGHGNATRVAVTWVAIPGLAL